MLDIAKNFYEILFDNKISVFRKIGKFTSLILILLIIDSLFNFTYNIQTSSKLNNLEKINYLKIVYKSDSTTLSDLNSIENKILKRKHYTELWSSLSLSDFRDGKNISQNQNQTHIDKKIKTIPIRSKLLMALSSSTVSIIVFIIIIFLPFFGKVENNLHFYVGWLAFIPIMAGIVVLNTMLFYLIPVIKGNPTFNYILNFIIQVIILFIMTRILRNKN